MVRWDQFALLSKGGHPWLLLPKHSVPARQALTLIPAQTRKARWAKRLLYFALGLGWCPRATAIQLARSSAHPWEQFLQRLTKRADLPVFASIAGNPNAAGQRLVFVVFDSHDQPYSVVKVGLGPQAAALIDREASFLRKLPPQINEVPRLLETFESETAHAFATEFCPGTTLNATSMLAPEPVLSRWINSSDAIPALTLPTLASLANHHSTALPTRWKSKLAEAKLRPVIMHGDFAPWNIRVEPDCHKWKVLDWERGELQGLPTWDWLHFVIQTEILVNKQPTATIIARINTLFRSAEFQQYLRATACVGLETDLLIGYLAHAVHVIRPSEGLAATTDLLNAYWQK